MASVPIPPGLCRSSFASDVVHPFRDRNAFIHTCGVFHARDSSTVHPSRHLWLEDVRLWPAAVAKYTLEGYNDFLFTEYSSASRWHSVHRDDNHLHISGTLSHADLFQYLPDPPEESDDTTQHHTNITDATGEDGAPEEKDQDAHALREMYENQQRHHEDLLRQQQQEINQLRARIQADADRAAAAARANAQNNNGAPPGP